MAELPGGEMDVEQTAKDDDQRSSCLPEIELRCKIEKCEIEKGKRIDGHIMVMIKFKVIQEKYRGYPHFERYNWAHPSKEAVRISKAQLSRVCRAVGLEKLGDTSQLVDKSLMVSFGKRIDKYNSNKLGSEVHENYIKGVRSDADFIEGDAPESNQHTDGFEDFNDDPGPSAPQGGRTWD